MPVPSSEAEVKRARGAMVGQLRRFGLNGSGGCKSRQEEVEERGIATEEKKGKKLKKRREQKKKKRGERNKRARSTMEEK